MKDLRRIAAAAFLTAAIPASGQATVVESLGGGLFMQAQALAQDSGELSTVATDTQGFSFDGAPISLSATATAKATTATGRNSASISIAATSNWVSPDEGTVNFSDLLTLHVDEQATDAYAGYDQHNTEWFYRFVANTDAVMNFTVHNIPAPDDLGLPGGEDLLGYNFLYLDGGNVHCFDHLNYNSPFNNCSIELKAGTTHYISISPAGFLGSRFVSGPYSYDDSKFLLTSFNFNIVAASSPPAGGGGGGSVPEPATWTMMIAGFGLAGGFMRRPRRAPFACDSSELKRPS